MSETQGRSSDWVDNSHQVTEYSYHLTAEEMASFGGVDKFDCDLYKSDPCITEVTIHTQYNPTRFEIHVKRRGGSMALPPEGFFKQQDLEKRLGIVKECAKMPGDGHNPANCQWCREHATGFDKVLTTGTLEWYLPEKEQDMKTKLYFRGWALLHDEGGTTPIVEPFDILASSEEAARRQVTLRAQEALNDLSMVDAMDDLEIVARAL